MGLGPGVLQGSRVEIGSSVPVEGRQLFQAEGLTVGFINIRKLYACHELEGLGLKRKSSPFSCTSEDKEI